MGGTSRPEIEYGLANLLCLCRRCHDQCEARDTRMHVRGMWLNSWENPAEIPVILADWTVAYLTDAGGYTDTYNPSHNRPDYPPRN
jgi:hypothetical protein